MRRIALAALAALAFACASARAQAPGGARIFVDPQKGNCIACHQVSDPAAPKTRSDVGPRLEGARMRAIGRDRLRALLTDPMANNPETMMPPYGRHRILDASEIDRVIDYLYALP